jgi:hypothetical protein
MLYICIVSIKLDLNQAIRVSHNKIKTAAKAITCRRTSFLFLMFLNLQVWTENRGENCLNKFKTWMSMFSVSR